MARFRNITTSGFKGLSLDEIMAVPLAKQARQDASLAATDELEALSSNRLDADATLVDKELDRFRKEAEGISNQLLERGVDRNLSNRLRKLRSDKNRQFGASGMIGQAESNYKAAQKYINDLATEKVQQAGWSPQEAKIWATSQVKNFGSSFDELGNFKQFKGSGLATKVESNDWINKNLKLVASDTNQELMQYTGDLDQFTKAFASGVIKDIDFEKIMTSLTVMAANDPSLQASLKQQQFFDPNSGDPKNIGTWEYRTREDGSKKKVFIPGNQFGRQLYGAAFGAQSSDQTYKFHYETDIAAKALYEKGIEAQEANDLVAARNGVLNSIRPDNFDKLKENVGLALDELDGQQTVFNTTWGTEEMRDQDPEAFKLMEAKRAANPTAYAQAKKELNDAKIGHGKLQNLLNSVETKALAKFTPEEKEEYNFANSIDSLKYKDEASKVKFITEELIKLGVDPDEVVQDGVGYMLNYKTGTSQQIKVNPSDQLLFALMEQKGYNPRGSAGSGQELNPQKAWDAMSDVKLRANELIKNELESNPYAESYKSFSALNDGKYSSKIGGLNKVLTEGFQGGAGYSEAYTGKDLYSYIQETYESDPEASEAKVTFELRVTDGTDEKGYPIEELIVKDRNGSILEVKAVTRGGEGESSQKSAGIELAKSSDPALAQSGRNMIATAEYMAFIKNADIRGGNTEGEFSEIDITNEATGEEIPIKWTKTLLGRRNVWKIHVGDLTSRELFSEQDIANYLYNELPKQL